MKYIEKPFTMTLINRIVSSGDREPFNTVAAADNLLHNYIGEKPYSVLSRHYRSTNRAEKPQFTVEKYIENTGEFNPHIIMEVQSHHQNVVPSQLFQRLLRGVVEVPDYLPESTSLDDSFSIFAVIMRGIYIGFYVYRNNPEMLTLAGVPHYLGFVPLSYQMNEQQWKMVMTRDLNNNHGFHRHISKREGIEHRSEILDQLYVTRTSSINYPHIYNLTDVNHADYIHLQFEYIFAKESLF